MLHKKQLTYSMVASPNSGFLSSDLFWIPFSILHMPNYMTSCGRGLPGKDLLFPSQHRTGSAPRAGLSGVTARFSNFPFNSPLLCHPHPFPISHPSPFLTPTWYWTLQAMEGVSSQHSLNKSCPIHVTRISFLVSSMEPWFKILILSPFWYTVVHNSHARLLSLEHWNESEVYIS